MNAFMTTLLILWGLEILCRLAYLLRGYAPERTFGMFAVDTVTIAGFFVWGLMLMVGN